MATKVVDASALAAIAFVEPEGVAISARLEGAALAAPGLLKHELASICLTKLRRNPEDEAAILQRYAAARGAPITMHDVEPVECVQLGRRLQLSAYDSSYLWLARFLNAELVTLDQKLARAAAAS